MRSRPAFAMAVLACLAAGAVAAQDRPPAERQGLADLARLLGQSHALRQVCQGPDDQFWRSRMQQLIDVEASDQALKQRLAVSFNAGYGAEQALYPDCTPAARQEAQRLARRGQSLAQALASP